jgi:hypothetical protein
MVSAPVVVEASLGGSAVFVKVSLGLSVDGLSWGVVDAFSLAGSGAAAGPGTSVFGGAAASVGVGGFGKGGGVGAFEIFVGSGSAISRGAFIVSAGGGGGSAGGNIGGGGGTLRLGGSGGGGNALMRSIPAFE